MLRYLVATLLVLASASHAQERTAGSTVETQMTWSALSAQISAVNKKTDLVNSRIDQVVICAKKGMVYTPGYAGADTEGCSEAAQSGNGTNNITSIVNRLNTTTGATTTNTNTVNSIIACNKAGQVFNGSACISAPKPTCSLATTTTGSNCPSGYVMTGGESGFTGTGNSNGRPNGTRTNYCSRVVCN